MLKQTRDFKNTILDSENLHDFKNLNGSENHHFPYISFSQIPML